MHELMHPRIRSRAAEQAVLDRSTVENLRSQMKAKADIAAGKPTADDIAVVVADLMAVTPLADTAAKMPRPTLAEATTMVLDIVATFGTWLTHSEGRSGVAVSFAADDEQLTLFQVARKAGRNLVKPVSNGPVTVKVPVGYEPGSTPNRDVTKALAAIVASAPSADVISRFASRTYRTRSSVLAYPLVAGVWKFATAGRLDAIDKVSPDPVFHAQVVAAYDLLDVARCEAIEYVRSIVESDQGLTPDHISRACERAGWLSELEFGRLRHAASAATDDKTTALLEIAVKRFKAAVRAEPGRYRPVSIAALTAGQVQRICAAAGLTIEDTTRTEELEIRSRLRELGFSRDADRLVPEGLRAYQRGQSAEFWAIMTARREGDQNWSEQLEELCS